MEDRAQLLLWLGAHAASIRRSSYKWLAEGDSTVAARGRSTLEA
jgi:hypothetical protein